MEDVYLYHSMFNADYRKARDELSKSEVKYKYISYKTLGKILRNKKTITNRGIIIKGCKKRIKLKLKLKLKLKKKIKKKKKKERQENKKV